MATVYLGAARAAGPAPGWQSSTWPRRSTRSAGARDARPAASAGRSRLQRVRGEVAGGACGGPRALPASVGSSAAWTSPATRTTCPRACWSAPPSSRAARRSTSWSPPWPETPRERETGRGWPTPATASPTRSRCSSSAAGRDARATRCPRSTCPRSTPRRCCPKAPARRPAGPPRALRAGRRPPLHAALHLERRGRPGPLPARLVHHEVQPQDERAGRAAARASPRPTRYSPRPAAGLPPALPRARASAGRDQRHGPRDAPARRGGPRRAGGHDDDPRLPRAPRRAAPQGPGARLRPRHESRERRAQRLRGGLPLPRARTGCSTPRPSRRR